MRRSLVLLATLFLASCNRDLPSPPDRASSRTNSSAPDSASSTAAATMSLLATTWEFSDDGLPTVVTIDRAGGYIEQRADGTPVVHGTYAQRDGMDCFTSAMGERRTSCWTAVPPTEIGESASATHENGTRAVFRRIAYRQLERPAN